jgi:hypothetical protein
MSTKCAEYHCPHPRACLCYGWCIGHRAAYATWICEHLAPPKPCPPSVPTPEPPRPCTPPVLPAIPEPDPEPEPVAEPLPPPMVSILRPAYTLDDVYEDDQDDQPSPSPPRTPEPSSETLTTDPVAELARVHAEHMAQITAEMESMKQKLKQYEEQKAIIENIQQLEAKCATLAAQPATQPATQQMPPVQKNAAPGQPVRQARPLPKVALPSLSAGLIKPPGQKKK